VRAEEKKKKEKEDNSQENGFSLTVSGRFKGLVMVRTLSVFDSCVKTHWAE
jgi:hypothetical protein